MKKTIAFLITLLNPLYWIQVQKYSFVWDKKLNELMKDNNFTEITEFTAKIGCVTVWIANHPYGSFNIYRCGFRPSRITIYLAMKKLKSDYKKQFESEINEITTKN